ncbi:MAG: hypothetical protein ACRESR_06275 [Gammaproteobacteria bacterium]
MALKGPPHQTRDSRHARIKTPQVEIVYFPGCPHLDAAREVLREALAGAGLSPVWREWNRDDSATPEALHKHDSPTVLMNDRDTLPASAQAANCCVCSDGPTLRGVPAIETIRAAIRASRTNDEADDGC